MRWNLNVFTSFRGECGGVSLLLYLSQEDYACTRRGSRPELVAAYFREANACTVIMARMGHEKSLDFHLFSTFPSELPIAFSADLAGIFFLVFNLAGTLFPHIISG